MKVTLVGVQDVNFTDSRTGEEIDGVKIHIVYPDVNDNTYGNLAENYWINRNVFDSFGFTFEDLINHIDEIINVEWNPKRKVVGITL